MKSNTHELKRCVCWSGGPDELTLFYALGTSVLLCSTPCLHVLPPRFNHENPPVKPIPGGKHPCSLCELSVDFITISHVSYRRHLSLYGFCATSRRYACHSAILGSTPVVADLSLPCGLICYVDRKADEEARRVKSAPRFFEIVK